MKELLSERVDLKFSSTDEQQKFLKRAKNVLCREFYILRNIPEHEISGKIHKLQLERNRLSPEFWIKRGLSKIEAEIAAKQKALEHLLKMQKNNKLLKNGLLSEEKRIEFCRASSSWCNSEVQRKNSQKHNKPQTIKYRQACHRLKEYWIARGFTEDEAIYQISKVQTRDKNFYIKKYGEIAGAKKFQQISNKKIETWKAKDKIEHAQKTAPKSGMSKQEEKAILMFIKQNNINSNTCMFGQPENQFWQSIPGVGFRRYDLAVFTSEDKKQLKLIFEYHGLFHSKQKVIDTNQCYTLGKSNTEVNINKSIDNDHNKAEHIKITFPNVTYCVAWPENLRKREMKIEHLRIY